MEVVAPDAAFDSYVTIELHRAQTFQEDKLP